MNILALGFSGAKFFEENIKKEAEGRGYTIDYCSASSIYVDVSKNGVEIRAGDLDLTTYDVIHVGAIASNRWPVIAALGYLKRVHGCTIVDGRLVDAKLDEYSGLSKYFLEEEHELFLPRSVVFKRFKEIAARADSFNFPVIIKTNNSKQGSGVGIAHGKEDITTFVKERLKIDPKCGFVLRELIPNDGDYRVNVINGKAVICLKRTPKEGEYRSNISLGGTLTNAGLEETKDICAAAEKIAQLGGYDIAGVDVMVHKETGDPYILEVNRAPSGLEDDEEVSGVPLAKLIVDFYESKRRSGSGYVGMVWDYFHAN